VRALSEVSGPEAKGYFEEMRTASAELLTGLGQYFRAMAAVEQVDILRPDSGALRDSAANVRRALGPIRRSVESTTRMVDILPEAFPEAVARVMAPRVELNIVEIERLYGAASSIVGDLEAGRYPSMSNCEAMNRALEDVIRTFIMHSQINSGEGF
jgi:hypothetical protein